MKNKLIHGVASVLFIGIPLLLQSNPSWLDLSAGAILNFVYLWVSSVVKPTIPVSEALKGGYSPR